MAAHARHDSAPESRAYVPLERDTAESLARTLRAVADPTRLQLLSMIAGAPEEEATVSDLAASLGLTQPTVTHHLKILVDDGVLVRDRRGKHIWHQLAPDRRASVLDLLR